MANDRSFFLVKLLVFAMGITLIAGVIVLIYLVYQRSIPATPAAQGFGPFPAFQSSKNDDCDGGELKIDHKATIDDVMLKDRHMVLLVNEPGDKGGQKLVVIDYCNNKVLSQIEFAK